MGALQYLHYCTELTAAALQLDRHGSQRPRSRLNNRTKRKYFPSTRALTKHLQRGMRPRPLSPQKPEHRFWTLASEDVAPAKPNLNPRGFA